mgnify:FL=1
MGPLRQCGGTAYTKVSKTFSHKGLRVQVPPLTLSKTTLHFTVMKCLYTETEFIEAVKTSKSVSETLRKLGLKATGGNFQTVKLKLKKFKCDSSHFEYNSKRLTKKPKTPQELEALLVEGSESRTSTHSLKNRLIKAGKLENKCSECELTEWRGKPLSLQLDHVNGVNNDNRLSNLRLLCPNCHSQTETYAGKKLKGNFKAGNCCSNCTHPIRSGRK